MTWQSHKKKKSPNNEIDLDVSTKEKPERKTTSRY